MQIKQHLCNGIPFVVQGHSYELHILYQAIAVLVDSDDYGDGGGFILGDWEDPGDESTTASSTAPSSSLACWSAASV